MKISVCMATYNGERYILEQLRSIISELSNDDEIIISDDSSTDNTLNIIKNICDKRIIVIENQIFKNPVYNFENALKHSSGDIIFLADQDDIWIRGKVKRIKKELECYNLIVHDADLINSLGEKLGRSLFEINKSKQGIIRNLWKNSYVGCCMAFDRKTLEVALPFPKDIPMHDSWLGLIAEKYGKVKFLNESLIEYRRHENNLSHTGEKSNRKTIKRILDRFNLIKNFNKR